MQSPSWSGKYVYHRGGEIGGEHFEEGEGGLSPFIFPNTHNILIHNIDGTTGYCYYLTLDQYLDQICNGKSIVHVHVVSSHITKNILGNLSSLWTLHLHT
jgi:hypothetical protein